MTAPFTETTSAWPPGQASEALTLYQEGMIAGTCGAATIILWFLINGSHPNQLAYIDKPAEVTLIILLLIEDWRARREVLSPRT